MYSENYTIGGISSIISKKNNKKILNNSQLNITEESKDTSAIKLFEKSNDNNIEFILPKGTNEIKIKKKKNKLLDLNQLKGKQSIKQRKEELKLTESRTIFIGNVPSELKILKIKKLFSEFGTIEQIYQRSRLLKNQKLTLKMIGTNKKLEKNLKTKIVYVRFETEKAAESAVKKMNGYLINENNLRVTLSSKTELKKSHSIFVGNIAFEAQEQELYNFFEKNCGSVDSVRIILDKKTGKNTGIGYVAFKNKASILSALNLNESEFYGRPLRISKIIKKNKRITKNNKFLNKKFVTNTIRTTQKLKNQRKQKIEDLAEKITQFSTFKTKDVINLNDKKKNIKKKIITKNVKNQIKKRQNLKKHKSLMI